MVETITTTTTTISNTKTEMVKIDSIKGQVFDFRDKELKAQDFTSEDFAQLKLSIETQGVITPIYISPDNKKKDGTFLLLDGARRIRAAQEIGLEKIPAIIISGDHTKNELALTALVQNIRRKNLTVTETTKAVIKLFAMNGFDVKDVLHYLNLIIIAENEKPDSSRRKRGTVDNKFKHVFNSLGYRASSLRAMIYVHQVLPPEILELAQAEGLGFEKQQLLTWKEIRNSPTTQTSLIYELKFSKNYQHAKTIVEKRIANILQIQKEEEEFDKRAGEVGFDQALNESISDEQVKFGTEPEVAKQVVTKYFDVVTSITRFLEATTGHTLEKGQTRYKEDNIKFTQSHRQEIVDYIQEKEADVMKLELLLVIEASDSLIKLIEKKYPPELKRLYPDND